MEIKEGIAGRYKINLKFKMYLFTNLYVFNIFNYPSCIILNYW